MNFPIPHWSPRSIGSMETLSESIWIVWSMKRCSMKRLEFFQKASTPSWVRLLLSLFFRLSDIAICHPLTDLQIILHRLTYWWKSRDFSSIVLMNGIPSIHFLIVHSLDEMSSKIDGLVEWWFFRTIFLLYHVHSKPSINFDASQVAGWLDNCIGENHL